jgi:hypothetical protein
LSYSVELKLAHCIRICLSFSARLFHAFNKCVRFCLRNAHKSSFDKRRHFANNKERRIWSAWAWYVDGQIQNLMSYVIMYVSFLQWFPLGTPVSFAKKTEGHALVTKIFITYRLMHALFHIRTVIIQGNRYRPEGFSPRVDIGRGMITLIFFSNFMKFFKI